MRKMQKQSKNWPGVQYPLKKQILAQYNSNDTTNKYAPLS